MAELSKQYEPKQHESQIYKKWEASGAFQPDQKALAAGKKPFVLMLPLPNVTGNLHMGHALQHTIMDIVVRYHRMLGDPTLWQPGTDHAGISTQNVVEKQLREQGITRHDLGREKFLERVWEWKEKSGGEILRQMRRLGASCDWQRDVFTMDPKYVHAVQEAFLHYYQRGYVYRGNRIVNWCPRCASVISDLETEYENRATNLITLHYPLADGSGYIDVATTRPETMLGDTAVAVHPRDERYHSLVGKIVRLPLTSREVPIIADERIDKNFGTGAVKVTPAHDPFDAELAVTHHLPAINIIGEHGKLTYTAGEFAGQTVAESREHVLEALHSAGVVQKEEEYIHKVILCARCGTVIEPLMSRQWFVDMGKLKKETIEIAEKELVKFLPSRWKKHFLHWMQNVHDWTISRQLWWGHQIPVWWRPGTRNTETEEGNYVVSIEKPAGDFEQDPDVLDTWFSSALWPFATLGWPESTEDLKSFYPTTVLITARDILYLWVARMMFSGLELMKGKEYHSRRMAKRIPFEEVFIHPTVLAKDGQRMSKSLGTGVDPIELIEKYGADATRFGLMYQMSYDSQAIKFDEDAIKSARNFANKIWNIARFLKNVPKREKESILDQWIKGRLSEVNQEVNRLLKEYKFGEATRVLYDFVWKDFADSYVESLKKEGSIKTARDTFQKTLALLHPFIPHLTELLWEGKQMLIFGPWPKIIKKKNKEAEQEVFKIQDVASTTRAIRNLMDIPPGEEIKLYTVEPEYGRSSLAAFARAKLVETEEGNMKKFPTLFGSVPPISIKSSSITPQSLNRAREKLKQQEVKLNTLVLNQLKILGNMRAHGAAEEKIAEKEKTVADTEKRLSEVTHSLELLKS